MLVYADVEYRAGGVTMPLYLGLVTVAANMDDAASEADIQYTLECRAVDKVCRNGGFDRSLVKVDKFRRVYL